MNIPTSALQATALCLSLAWLVLALAQRPRRALAVVWALFCGSIAMLMARGLVGPEAGPWHALFGLGACFTCNGFWLVSRALFREGRPFAAPHVAYAGVVALLIVVSQYDVDARTDSAVAQLLGLLSSVNLVLAFAEGVRGWPAARGTERRMRTVFLLAYGGCVGAVLLLPSVLGQSDGTRDLLAAAAATAIVFVTQGLVAWRLRHPLASPAVSDAATGIAADEHAPDEATCRETRVAARVETALETGIRGEDAALAEALERHMRAQRPFLQPELKLSHLAQALDSSEYRVSRAIHEVLGHRNVSQYVNAFRIAHAHALLLDPGCDEWSTLVIGLESGFGSLGAFHRAFKAAMGAPPGEFRLARQALPGPTPGGLAST